LELITILYRIYKQVKS